MLEVEDLHAYYGKSHILHGVHLRVGQGEIVSLLGRNGVGRSTTVKAIMGQVDAERLGAVQGRARCSGARPTRSRTRAWATCRRAATSSPRSPCEQNLMLGMKGAQRQPARWNMEDMYRLFPRLKERATRQAGMISGGEQQMLTLCRTLMGDPDLVMIDEPTEGLAPKIVELVAELFKEIKQPRRVDPAGGAEARDRAQHLAAPVRHGPRPHRVRGHAAGAARRSAMRKEWLEV